MVFTVWNGLVIFALRTSWLSNSALLSTTFSVDVHSLCCSFAHILDAAFAGSGTETPVVVTKAAAAAVDPA